MTQNNEKEKIIHGMNEISKALNIDKKHFVTVDGIEGVSFTLREWNQFKLEIQEIVDNDKREIVRVSLLYKHLEQAHKLLNKMNFKAHKEIERLKDVNNEMSEDLQFEREQNQELKEKIRNFEGKFRTEMSDEFKIIFDEVERINRINPTAEKELHNLFERCYYQTERTFRENFKELNSLVEGGK